MNAKTMNPEHLRTPGHSAAVSPAEMAGRIARFRELEPDPFAFPDLKQQQGKR